VPLIIANRRGRGRRVCILYSLVALALLVAGCADKSASGPSSGAPTLTSVAPASGAVGSTVSIAVSGTNFAAGSTSVAIGGSGVTATNVVVASPTSMTATVTVSAAAAIGARALTVTNSVGASSEQSFTVTAAARPGVTSVGPASAAVGTNVTVTVTGSGFLVGGTTRAAE
jgi:hypothetical protein